MANKFPKTTLIIVVLGIFLLLAGCQDKQELQSFELDGEIYEFPDFVFAQIPNAPHAYAFATEARDVLKYFPCYCGCHVESINHRSNLDCFFDEEQSTDEMIVYDDHGAG
ncbi:hypothetical protein J2S00_000439 [Caldalkalibacillus uzonensis]|uniref:Lipoprotein n=2 Tax=Caldalkalibacillus uzonensis TaxID=353224 RepID=A0ABU0CP56_9BACI|nr:hypothetical protein [Caldalkalibacillus uzonensis]